MAKAFVMPGLFGPFRAHTEIERLYIDLLKRGYKVTSCKAEEDGSYKVTAEAEIVIIKGGFCNEFKEREVIIHHYTLKPRHK